MCIRDRLYSVKQKPFCLSYEKNVPAIVFGVAWILPEERYRPSYFNIDEIDIVWYFLYWLILMILMKKSQELQMLSRFIVSSYADDALGLTPLLSICGNIYRFSFWLTMTLAHCHWFMSIDDNDWYMADIWLIYDLYMTDI